ncbi:MAG: hypothetical protein ACRD50_09750 [Candidatus Acidiferrales bacterium]
MLTIFSTPKPFCGHINVIQRNAIVSWKHLHPGCEVILFGPEEGARETALELGIRHEPKVQCNEYGTKYLASFFDRAQQIARHDVLCYVNCDIILTSDFRRAVEKFLNWPRPFLMAGQRWDLDVREPLEFTHADWEEQIRSHALDANNQRPPQWIDYFVFSRGLFLNRIPRFVIGRPSWDNWLIWYARHSGAAVIDASSVVTPIHQNHDYSYHPDGEEGVWQGDEARENQRLLGGRWHCRTLEDARYRLTPAGLQRNTYYWVLQGKRAIRAYSDDARFAMLKVTRPFRRALGLPRERFSGALKKP